MLSLSLIFILVPKWKLIYQCLLPLVLLKRHADLCALCTWHKVHSDCYSFCKLLINLFVQQIEGLTQLITEPNAGDNLEALPSACHTQHIQG